MQLGGRALGSLQTFPSASSSQVLAKASRISGVSSELVPLVTLLSDMHQLHHDQWGEASGQQDMVPVHLPFLSPSSSLLF